MTVDKNIVDELGGHDSAAPHVQQKLAAAPKAL